MDQAITDLTPSELAILQAVADGKSYSAIACSRKTSVRTVKAQMASVKTKLGGADNNAQAVARAVKFGIITVT